MDWTLRSYKDSTSLLYRQRSWNDCVQAIWTEHWDPTKIAQVSCTDREVETTAYRPYGLNTEILQRQHKSVVQTEKLKRLCTGHMALVMLRRRHLITTYKLFGSTLTGSGSTCTRIRPVSVTPEHKSVARVQVPALEPATWCSMGTQTSRKTKTVFTMK